MLACAVAAGAIATVVATDGPRMSAGALTLHAIGVAIPLALAAFCLATGRTRLAVPLFAAAALSGLTTLAESRHSVLYSFGRVSVWLLEPLVVYLILSFPLSRLRGGLERILFRATLALVAVLYLPTALIADYPTPSPWSSCGTHCPPNAFNLDGPNPAIVGSFARPLREIATIVIFVAVAALVTQRARRGSALMRAMLIPIVAIVWLRALAMLVYFPDRAAGGTSGFSDVLGSVYAYSLPALAVAIAAGLITQRLFVASSLQRLALSLSGSSTAAELRSALADAIRDPELTIVFWVPDEQRWVDEMGWPVGPPEATDDRAVTEVRSDGRLLAAIVHDVALSTDPMLVTTAASYALTAVENERLVAELQSSLRELSESRVRIVSVADRERRKIERDLHDGAQQRLVALRVKLGLVAERLQPSTPAGADEVRHLADDVEETIDEVRAFARGVYPSLLAERGLSEALRAAGRSAAVPTMVDAAGVGRYPPEIESTVYFACTEALQNVSKHAHGATGVIIRVRGNGRVEFEVRDDGEGIKAADIEHGTGLSNLRERIAAVGGDVTVESMPGGGTKVAGVVPVG